MNIPETTSRDLAMAMADLAKATKWAIDAHMDCATGLEKSLRIDLKFAISDAEKALDKLRLVQSCLGEVLP